MRLDRDGLIAMRAEFAAGTRTCTGCGAVKPLDQFYGKTEKPFLMAECRECFKERAARRRAGARTTEAVD